MKLKIENGLLYVDNQRFCFAEVEGMDGSTPTGSRPVGPRAVVTQYSADHGDILPRVADYGWIGARTGRRIVSVGSAVSAHDFLGNSMSGQVGPMGPA